MKDPQSRWPSVDFSSALLNVRKVKKEKQKEYKHKPHRCTVVKKERLRMPRELFSIFFSFFFFYFFQCCTARTHGVQPGGYLFYDEFFLRLLIQTPKVFPLLPSPGASGPKHSYSNDIVSFPSSIGPHRLTI